MDIKEYINGRVEHFYWSEDVNCAIATLRILGEVMGIELSAQVIDAATGMHGAGKFGAQCGLVEGSLMFLGILGRQEGLPEEEISESCYKLAFGFERHFGSLMCRDLRPQGFGDDQPPHLCEELTKQAVLFAVEFINDRYNIDL